MRAAHLDCPAALLGGHREDTQHCLFTVRLVEPNRGKGIRGRQANVGPQTLPQILTLQATDENVLNFHEFIRAVD